MSETSPEVELSIDGAVFTAWSTLAYTEVYDGVATLDLSAPWDPERAEALQAFAPLSLVDVELKLDSDSIYFGTALDPDITVTEDDRSISHTSYSKPGVLQDNTMPPESFPLEWTNAPFSKIAEDVCGAFDLEVEIDPQLEKFKRASLKPEDKPWDFLVELAKQRDALVASTRSGAVSIFRPADSLDPVAILVEGEPALSSIVPKFNAREYHSDVTCTAGRKLGRRGGKATAQNTLYSGSRRPLIQCVDKSDRGDLVGASTAALGRVFAGAAGWRCVVPSWLTDSGSLWAAGQFVRVKATSCYIRREFDFRIRAVNLMMEPDAWWAELDIVLPESFTGTVPKDVPWLA
jgi:prophage tail gpP-like protein